MIRSGALTGGSLRTRHVRLASASMNAHATRRKILVLNQYYWPGVEATAQLLAQLCEALARD